MDRERVDSRDDPERSYDCENSIRGGRRGGGGNRNVCGNENKSSVQSTLRSAAPRRDDVRTRPFRYAFIPSDGEILSPT